MVCVTIVCTEWDIQEVAKPRFEDDKFLPVFFGSVGLLGSGISVVCCLVVELTTGPGPPTHYIILYIAVL